MAITGAIGETQDFGFMGSAQAYRVPVGGIYKMEVWGAGGGKWDSAYLGEFLSGDGAPGGYACGYAILNEGATIYVCVGGAGKGNSDGYLYGSFNGGGSPGYGGGETIYGGASGGGATHIAAMDGTLEQIGEGNLSRIFIVAGGGGGGGGETSILVGAHDGGAGGGYEGAPGGGATGGRGGTQSVGGAGAYAGSFGRGGQGHDADGSPYGAGSGGGGGLYGGGGGNAGGGGSGYVGGVPGFSMPGASYQPTTTQGAGAPAETDGMARLTYMGRAYIPVHYDGTHLQRIHFNGTELEHLVYNGAALYCRRLDRKFRERTRGMRRGGSGLCLT